MLAILHKELKLPGTLHRTLQILSVHPFEKVTFHELLAETNLNSLIGLTSNQLTLWWLTADSREECYCSYSRATFVPNMRYSARHIPKLRF